MSMNIDDVTFAEIYKKVTKQWLTPSELEEEYGFSKSTQAKMRMASNSSNLPFSKIGKFIRYDRKLIDKWIRSHQIQGENNV